MRRVKMLLLAAVCVRTILSQTIAKVMLTVELEDGRVEKTLVPGDVIEHRVREWCMELRAAEMPDCISGITTQLLEAHAIKAARRVRAGTHHHATISLYQTSIDPRRTKTGLRTRLHRVQFDPGS